ncbi:MAG: HXXEE domain-containing protein [Paracoccaceae bacterium]
MIAFAMLWVPLGQHGFLLAHWMKLGTFMAPFLLFVALAVQPRMPLERNLRLLSLLLLLAYIAHQFEEHWIDLYGNTYAFKPYVNQLVSDALAGDMKGAEPLTDAGVFVINTSLVWLVAALAIWRAPDHVFPMLCLTAIVLVNAISHILAGVLRSAYNPGLLTAVLIFLPLAIAVYGLMLRTGAARIWCIAVSLVWGVLAHVVMVAGIIASGALHVIPEWSFFLALAIWSVLPIFLVQKA